MCGIAGFIGALPGTMPEGLDAVANAMSRALQHRGPDDQGTWIDRELGAALVHLRLSIVDLSPAGHQPMASANGRYVIVFNGEVYSFQEIRKDLEARGVTFRGHSDTEVILESIVAFGLDATLKRMIGMFAIALWDRKERTLTLIRDRLGIKPVYWAKFGSLFMFGSELKALRACPGWTPLINRDAVAAYMRHNYIPAPHTIYQGVSKLEPGCVLTLPWSGKPAITRFWDPRAVAKSGLASPLQGSDSELTDQLETLLKDAVKRRMVADVPLGAFLSGGVDSSTVAALMQSAGMGRVKTFSIGFDIPDFDEAPHAAAVARHLGTDHTELMVTSQQALDVIPRLPEWYDEPFADSSQIPTYLVSAMTRRHVTVALSGDGGDELFAGYNRYHLTQRFWRWISLMPLPLRKAVAAALTAVPPDRWTAMLSKLPGGLPQIGDKLHKAAPVLKLDSPDALYRQLVTHWEPGEIVLNAREPQGILDDRSLKDDIPDVTSRMQFLDLVTYLPDDILTKVDRASMAVALEARVPLIDHRVVEFSWRLPRNVMVRDGVSKWLLRQVLYRHVPPALVERPKMGFGVPLGEWLRGPLRDWAETLLSERRLNDSGLLDAAQVRRKWDEHLKGQRNWQYPLWDVLMLEAWLERWT
jgi:asparagine synthase (glutamine-hydrolysing)